MKSAVETLNPTRVRLTVEVPFEELKDSLDAAYKKINQQVTVKHIHQQVNVTQGGQAVVAGDKVMSRARGAAAVSDGGG